MRVGARWAERPDRTEIFAGDPIESRGGRYRVAYEYNELGFRGPSFDPDARFLAFVFGESDAFGAEVEFEDVWAVRVAHAVARSRGLPPHEVCVQNFAEEGASNAHIARMVLTQCAAVRPDLVVVNFAEEERTEGYGERGVYAVGPWLEGAAAEEILERTPDELRAWAEERVERGRAFLRFADRRQALLDTLRDVLLVQNTLAALAIDAVSISRRSARLFARATRRDPILGPLVDQLDPAFLPRFRPTRLRWRNDWGADRRHYGPRTHGTIASRVIAHLEEHAPHVLGPGRDEGARAGGAAPQERPYANRA